MADFAHLHVHTEYSLLDGMSRIKDLVAHTKALGMDALAITDHGAMYGVIEFYRACKAEGIKPIIGMEAYLAPRGMESKDPQLDKSAYHLLLIAQNQAGYKNLLKIASVSQLDGFYYRPRIDKEFLAAHAEGLICTTGCLAAEIPQLMLAGRKREAQQMLGWYWDVFGPDRFYIELQDHNIPELHQLNRMLHELGPYANIPYLATNDVHYVRREDASPHDILLCIGTGSLVADPKRMRFSGDTFYLRSPEEMWELFGEVPEALTNTVRVAEMCDIDLDDKEYKLPSFPVPEGYDAANYLRELVEQGVRWRYGDRAETAEVRERMEHELHVIHDMGFDTYFLIVWDLCEFARREDIWWNVRGSGAGSVVAYALGITSIDPLQNGLLFERFLNPGRKTMPDIDLDYPDDQRARMIEYCAHRYGDDRVAAIITFGTLGARAAVRDVGRTQGIPLDEVNRLASTIPNIPGKPVTLAQMLADPENPEYLEFHTLYNDPQRPYLRTLVDTAMKLEGIARHASTHAAGVLVSDRPLVEYVPLHRPTKGDSSDTGVNVVTQWPMAIVESIGLLKVDFLGLRTLTIMRKACELIERYHGVSYNLENIPYRHIPGADEHNAMLDKAFELLWRGETSGVFQVEGQGMTRMLMDMKPSRFEHIVAAISLFRPGPIDYIPTYIRRMHNEEPVTYHHPLLEPILSETFGIIVYQEQIMEIASSLFGYSLGDADLMRRAVAKKKEKDLKKHRAIFRKNGPEHGIPEEVADKIFDDIEFFARYGFNKSHAADYAVLTVQTAFLKAHYKHEYMAALLSIEHGNSDKVRSYIAECRRQGIQVLPPDIAFSDHEFVIEELPDGRRAIRYGLSAVKNVGEGAIDAILDARAEGPFEDVADFCQRVDMRLVGKRALECLIKVGALDSFGLPRNQLLESLDRLVSFSSRVHQAADIGQMSLFGEATGVQLDSDPAALIVPEATSDVSSREMRQWEQELLGMYVSEHPLQAIIDKIGKVVTLFSHDITEEHHNRPARMAGMVIEAHPHMSRSGKQMGFAEVEDISGSISVLIWPRCWDESKDIWQAGRVVLMTGKIDASRQPPKFLCDEVTTNFEVFEALDDGPPTIEAGYGPLYYEEPPPYYDSAPPPGFDEDYHAPTHEAPSGDDKTSADRTEPEAQAGIPSVPGPGQVARPPANGGGAVPMASVGGKAASMVRPAQAAAAERPGAPCHLMIRFRRSGDAERDKRRLRKVHGILYSHPGPDQFSVRLVGGGPTVQIDFKETTDHAQVIDLIREELGPDAVEIVDR
ncbi:MAG: DNA polymerase III subunit alpha [Anaerolineae bacterium]